MAEYTPFSKINYDLFKQNYDPNLPYNEQSQTIQQKYNEDLFNKYSGIASEEPKLGFIDKFTGGLEKLFSAYGAEKTQVPNLDYGYNVPTFDLATGITNTTAASPFKIGIENILDQYNVPNLQSRDLVQQIIAENQAKANPFVRPNMLDIAGGITEIDLMEENQLPYSGVGDMGYTTPRTIADQNKILGQTFTEQKPSGIEKLMSYLPFGENSITGRLIRALPQESPEIRSMKNFYRDQYGLTPTGQVASGIMAGYNPVYGGALNMLTGGRFGTPTQFGLANAARQRIENIAKRRAPQTDASRAKIAELQKFAEADTISRARQAAPDVYSKADSLGLTGPGGGFKSAGTNENFSNKTGRGRTGY